MLLQKIDAINKRRAAADPLPGGSGPFTSSNHFRSPQPAAKRMAKRWDHYLSHESLSQVASELKISSRGGPPSGSKPIISLGTGRPATHYFPWTSLRVEASCTDPITGKSKLRSMTCCKGEPEYDLDIAMNYGFSAGAPQTLRFITEHVEMVHDPPYKDWECAVSCGSTSALEIALRLFCNRGDFFLVEENTYPGTLSTAGSQGLQAVAVAVDELGICPDALDQTLLNWDPSKGRKPFVLYTIPCGQNPTGSTQSLARRQAIYHLAEKHDLYIIEDDPYYFLNLGPPPKAHSTPEYRYETPDEYLALLPPSYLSMDVSGRVMRMDTASKILSPGLRFGWVVASSQIIDKFVFHSEGGVLAPSGASQAMVYKLLDQTWGHEGFISWLSHLSAEYRRRRDILLQACDAFLPKELCQWSVPTSGMFLWVKIIAAGGRPGAVEKEIYELGLKKGVLVSKGGWFAVDKKDPACACFRMSFAAASDDGMRTATQLFSEVILDVCK